MEAVEDIPRLYPGPFWAAYGALEGGGTMIAQTRADLAERIVGMLVDSAEIGAGRPGASVRIDNTTLPAIVTKLAVEVRGVSTNMLRAAVYAAARVLTVG